MFTKSFIFSIYIEKEIITSLNSREVMFSVSVREHFTAEKLASSDLTLNLGHF